mgnify:CR=1 FL=1
MRVWIVGTTPLEEAYELQPQLLVAFGGDGLIRVERPEKTLQALTRQLPRGSPGGGVTQGRGLQGGKL